SRPRGSGELGSTATRWTALIPEEARNLLCRRKTVERPDQRCERGRVTGRRDSPVRCDDRGPPGAAVRVRRRAQDLVQVAGLECLPRVRGPLENEDIAARTFGQRTGQGVGRREPNDVSGAVPHRIEAV